MPHLKNKKNTVLKIAVVIFCLLLWNVVSAVSAFFWTVFLLWWAFRLDPRIVGGVAISFLVSIPIFFFLKMEGRAEEFSVYVYFLLAITVALKIIEFWREKPERQIKKSSSKPLEHEKELTPLPHEFFSPNTLDLRVGKKRNENK